MFACLAWDSCKTQLLFVASFRQLNYLQVCMCWCVCACDCLFVSTLVHRSGERGKVVTARVRTLKQSSTKTHTHSLTHMHPYLVPMTNTRGKARSSITFSQRLRAFLFVSLPLFAGNFNVLTTMCVCV